MRETQQMGFFQQPVKKPGAIPKDFLEEKVDLETIIILNNNAVWKNPATPE
ncbi:MAG TPA: hypothetical protein VMV04_09205 [Thermodesulfobacteriota bacterium]|nr:hypothetical protein [Thermodesulfobacteriota bacterium]